VGQNFLKDFGGTRALLVGVAIAAMKMTGTVHPPVGAYAVLMADVPAIKVFDHTHTHTTHSYTHTPNDIHVVNMGDVSNIDVMETCVYYTDCGDCFKDLGSKYILFPGLAGALVLVFPPSLPRMHARESVNLILH
jgi:hypothetical protein